MNRVKEIRSWTGLSQVKFAKRYGIPKSTLECWEAGTREYKDYTINWLETIVKNDLQNLVKSCLHTLHGMVDYTCKKQTIKNTFESFVNSHRS